MKPTKGKLIVKSKFGLAVVQVAVIKTERFLNNKGELILNQKEAKATREMFYKECEELMPGDFSFEGHVREGILFSNDKGNFVVLKAIVKQDTFDSTDAMEEWEEAQIKAKKRAEKKEK